jgi:hypothetical protein
LPTISAEAFRRTYAGFHLGEEKIRNRFGWESFSQNVLRPWDNGDLEFQDDAQLVEHGLVCGKGQMIVSAMLGDLLYTSGYL